MPHPVGTRVLIPDITEFFQLHSDFHDTDSPIACTGRIEHYFHGSGDYRILLDREFTCLPDTFDTDDDEDDAEWVMRSHLTLYEEEFGLLTSEQLANMPPITKPKRYRHMKEEILSW